MTKTRKNKPSAGADSMTGRDLVNRDLNVGDEASADKEQTSEAAPAAPVSPAALAKPAPAAKPASKQQQLAELVIRDEGATLDQMVAALGWLPHTTRAALTVLKKKGLIITSDKIDGVRTYRAVAPE